MIRPKEFLTRLFRVAVQSCQAESCIPAFLPLPPKGRTIVVGAGKAAAAMAQAFERHWDRHVEGVVVTRYGYAVPCKYIRVVEAAHPLPDSAGATAARLVQEQVDGLTADDLVVCLFSGGGSALLELPLPGLTLADVQSVNRDLLRSGATIAEVNCVRRHLSGIKGGSLAVRCAPARVVNLLISDVPGDQPHDIASGPTVADPTTVDQALDVVRRYDIALPPAARSLLASAKTETPKPDDPRFDQVETHVIATPRMALEAAGRAASAAGVAPLVLGDRIEGEAREVGKVLAGIALGIRAHRLPLGAPCVVLSGGEATVTVRGEGKGGPNVEFLLSTAISLNGTRDIYALAADTDGVDGAAELAGAVITPDTLMRAQAAGLAPRAYLDRNDAHTFFQMLGDSLATGPTLTNVNDFRAVLVLPMQDC